MTYFDFDDSSCLSLGALVGVSLKDWQNKLSYSQNTKSWRSLVRANVLMWQAENDVVMWLEVTERLLQLFSFLLFPPEACLDININFSYS